MTNPLFQPKPRLISTRAELLECLCTVEARINVLIAKNGPCPNTPVHAVAMVAPDIGFAAGAERIAEDFFGQEAIDNMKSHFTPDTQEELGAQGLYRLCLVAFATKRALKDGNQGPRAGRGKGRRRR